MIEVLIRPAAEADIEDIADYTIKRWGRGQARTYVAALRSDISSLSEYATRFPLHEQSGLGLRRMISGHHHIFYLANGATVEIVRVLHQRMDVPGQFD